jgi:hypothetical protein
VQGCGRKFRYLTGKQTANQREKAIEDFRGDKASVLLGHPKAGGVALTLTEATVVIFTDPWFTPQPEMQAAARTHRPGQTRAVRVIYLIITGSIEEWVRDVSRRKLDIADSLLGTETAASKRLLTNPRIDLQELARGLTFLRSNVFEERDTEAQAIDQARRHTAAMRMARTLIPRLGVPRDQQPPERAWLCGWLMQKQIGNGDEMPRQCLLWSLEYSKLNRHNFFHYHWLHLFKQVLTMRQAHISSAVSTTCLIASVTRDTFLPALVQRLSTTGALGSGFLSVPEMRLYVTEERLKIPPPGNGQPPRHHYVRNSDPCDLNLDLPQLKVRQVGMARLDPNALLLDAYLQKAGLLGQEVHGQPLLDRDDDQINDDAEQFQRKWAAVLPTCTAPPPQELLPSSPIELRRLPLDPGCYSVHTRAGILNALCTNPDTQAYNRELTASCLAALRASTNRSTIASLSCHARTAGRVVAAVHATAHLIPDRSLFVLVVDGPYSIQPVVVVDEAEQRLADELQTWLRLEVAPKLEGVRRRFGFIRSASSAAMEWLFPPSKWAPHRVFTATSTTSCWKNRVRAHPCRMPALPDGRQASLYCLCVGWEQLFKQRDWKVIVTKI